ncbi:MAG: DUF952 domain-containing protein [Bdellovibrionales bacterium]|nr:DUF952 domain-containing protein [Bdellovibrionales bacterium]
MLDKEFVYKVLRVHEWDELQETGKFWGSNDDKRDGYIHLSKQDQINGVVDRYFSNESIIYILAYKASRFSENHLKWEHSISIDDYFPHLYKVPLTIADLDNVKKIVRATT